jgi:hypothetical protein
MKSTRTKEYKNDFQAHILGCIDSEEVELNTPKEKIDHLFQEFDRVANYPNNLHNIPNEQERLADYLMGLPFSFEYQGYKIIKLAEQLHECELTDKQRDSVLKHYWSHLAYHILKLRNELG